MLLNRVCSVTIPYANSTLQDDIVVSFPEANSQHKQLAGPGGGITSINYAKWLIDITIGSTKWTSDDREISSLPYCQVGLCDNGNFVDWIKYIFSLWIIPKDLPVSLLSLMPRMEARTSL
jgi:hypothetical protein